MIALPFNDLHCLGSITEVVAELVQHQDPVLSEIAAKHATTEGLARWIRTLPQRDDDGDPKDGPKVEACQPVQRLRIPADDPNCVERAALYVAVAELIDPAPVRQLATLDTPNGLHTFPVENGAPVILDPRVPRNCLECGVALTAPGALALDGSAAIEWSARLAEVGAGTTRTRNGASRVRRARNAIVSLVDHGVVPAPADVDAMGWMFALAEQAARRFGHRALALVRTTAHAIAEILDEVLARTQRNLGIEIDGTTYSAPSWLSPLATAAGRIGLDIGAAVAAPQLAALGIGPDMVGLVENELNREGLSLGPFAHPPKLGTFANLQKAA